MNNLASSLAQQRAPPSTLPPPIEPETNPSPSHAPFSRRHPTFTPRAAPSAPTTTITDTAQKGSPTRDRGSASFPSTTGATREALLAQARAWAERAVAVGRAVPAERRTDECDTGCATAVHNLGTVAEMLEEWREAGERFAEAERLWKGLGDKGGVERAREGRERAERRKGG